MNHSNYDSSSKEKGVGEDPTPFYRSIHQEKEIFKACFHSQTPLLLKGPTGCGKSQFVEAMAFELKRPLIKVACNEDTTSTDLLGRFIIKGNETVWVDGPAVHAVKMGAILYLDEIAEARQDVLVALHSLTDHRREVYLDRINQVIRAPAEFMCVASYNPGYQNGLKELKPSTKQRFVALSFNYPPIAIETEIIQHESGISSEIAQKLCRFAERMRATKDLQLKETVSTRLLIQTALLHKQGLDLRTSAHLGIAEVLSDHPQTVLALKNLIDLSF